MTVINESSLIFGEDIKIIKHLSIKNAKLSEIREFGLDLYEKYINVICLIPYDIAYSLWADKKIWYEDITAWDLFIYSYAESDLYKEALEWFTGKSFSFVDGDKPYLYYECNGESVILDEGIFTYISAAIRSINYAPETKKVTNYTNRKSEFTYLKRQHEKMIKSLKKNKKPTISLWSIVSALAWDKCINPNILLDYEVSKIYEGYLRTKSKEDYNQTIAGIYAGNIDGSKIDMEKINWSRILSV